MKRNFIILSSLMSMIVMGQDFCGSDHIHAEVAKEYPEVISEMERIEERIRAKNRVGFRSVNLTPMSEGVSSPSETIYEILVVVHIIQSSSKSSSSSGELYLSDDQIKAWIESANKIYATTKGGNFFTKDQGGGVMPFRLVLAKKTKDCQATTGIVRHDASSLAKYEQYGVQSNGATEAEILKLAPHWPESEYYNIYIL